MKKSYFDSGGNDTELIAVLNVISQVPARMTRNMTLLVQQRQSEKGEHRYEQNERYGYDHRYGQRDHLPSQTPEHFYLRNQQG